LSLSIELSFRTQKIKVISINLRVVVYIIMYLFMENANECPKGTRHSLMTLNSKFL